MQRKTLLIVLLLLSFSSGCRDSSDENQNVFIGAALPLSGPVAYYGRSAQEGMTLALEEVNAAGGLNGRKLEVIYEDTRGTAKDAISGMRKLIDVHRVPAVIGAGSSTETLAITRIAEDNKVVLISPVSSAAEIREAGDYIFRSVPSDGFQAQMLAKWVLDDGNDEIGLIFVNSGWGTSLKNHFVKAYEKMGGKILKTESAEVDDKDFRTQLLNLNNERPDVIVAITYAKGGGRLLKQAREQGITLPFFGADPWTIEDFLAIAGQAAEGARYTTPGKYDGPEYKEFLKKYVGRYSKEPDVYAGHGYDCLKLIAMAIEQGARTGPDIQKALSQVEGFQGATGTTTFDDYGDVVSKEFVRMKVERGRAVPVTD